MGGVKLATRVIATDEFDLFFNDDDDDVGVSCRTDIISFNKTLIASIIITSSSY